MNEIDHRVGQYVKAFNKHYEAAADAAAQEEYNLDN